jgi:hypothetical protein
MCGHKGIHGARISCHGSRHSEARRLLIRGRHAGASLWKPAAFPGHGDAHKEVMLWTTIGALVEGSNPEEKLKGFMDPALKDAYPLDMAFAMAELARTCVDEDLNHRPTIDEIQRALSTWLSASSSSPSFKSV